jgi:hypothetical protein
MNCSVMMTLLACGALKRTKRSASFQKQAGVGTNRDASDCHLVLLPASSALTGASHGRRISEPGEAETAQALLPKRGAVGDQLTSCVESSVQLTHHHVQLRHSTFTPPMYQPSQPPFLVFLQVGRRVTRKYNSRYVSQRGKAVAHLDRTVTRNTQDHFASRSHFCNPPPFHSSSRLSGGGPTPQNHEQIWPP